MKRYKVEMQREGSVKYFFIRDMETLEIVLLPSKYLMHQVRANRSPNTIRRNAFALAYYWEYLLEEEHEAEDVFKNLIWNEKVWTGDLCKTVECCTGTRRSRANALRTIVNTIHSCL